MKQTDNKMRYISTLFTIFLLLNSLVVSADNTIGDPSITNFKEIKSNADSSYSGSQPISIPLFTLTGRSSLSLPITLQYFPGIKTHQEAGVVGLGWSIDAGAVQRGVKGFADDKTDQGYYIAETNRIDEHDTNEGACVDKESGRITYCDDVSPYCDPDDDVWTTECELSNENTCLVNEYCKRYACLDNREANRKDWEIQECYSFDDLDTDDYECYLEAGPVYGKIVEVYGSCNEGYGIECGKLNNNCLPEYYHLGELARDGALYDADKTTGSQLTEGLRQDNYYVTFSGGATPLMFHDENGPNDADGVTFYPTNWKAWDIDYTPDYTNDNGVEAFKITDTSGVKYSFNEIVNTEYTAINYPNVEILSDFSYYGPSYSADDMAGYTNNEPFSYTTYKDYRDTGHSHDAACRRTPFCPYPYVDDETGIYYPMGDAIAIELDSDDTDDYDGHYISSTYENNQYIQQYFDNFNYQIKFWKGKDSNPSWASAELYFLAKNSKGAAGGVMAHCGNNVIEPGEECDGTASHGKTCTPSGAPTCIDSTCKLDFGTCTANQCDEYDVGAGDIDGFSCSDFGYEYGDTDCIIDSTIYVPSFEKCGIADSARLAKNTGATSQRDEHAVAWLLTEITSPDYYDDGDGVFEPEDKGDYITITYDDEYGQKTDKTNDLLQALQKFNSQGTQEYVDYYVYDYIDKESHSHELGINIKSDIISKTDIRVIDEIITPIYSAKFRYSGDDNEIPQLEDITISDMDDNRIAVIYFTYAAELSQKELKDSTYYPSSDNSFGERTLLSVQQCGSDDQHCLPKTEFDYGNRASSTDNPSFNIDLKDDRGRKTENTDPWGFYSETTSNGKYVVDTNNDAWTLKKITYPTGGYVEYEWEPNTYKYYPTDNDEWCDGECPTNPIKGGGVRLKKGTTNYGVSDNGNPEKSIASFEYFDGVATQKPYQLNEYYNQNSGMAQYTIPWNTVGMVNNYIAYEKIRKKVLNSDTETADYGYVDTYYITPYDMPDEDFYDYKSQLLDQAGTFYVGGYMESNEWQRGLVDKIETYNAEDNKIAETIYHYESSPTAKVTQTVPQGNAFYDETETTHGSVPEYDITTGWRKLEGAQTTVDGVTSSVKYEYNDENGLIRKVTSYPGTYTTTDTEKRISYTMYAYEYEASPDQSAMEDKNMLSQVTLNVLGHEDVYLEDDTVFSQTFSSNQYMDGMTYTYYEDMDSHATHEQWHPSKAVAWIDNDDDGVYDGSSEEIVTTFDDYDVYGHLVESTNPNGVATFFYYGSNQGCSPSDTFNRGFLTCVKTEDDTDHQYTKAWYNNDGTTSRIIDNNDVETYFGYDELNRLIWATLPDSTTHAADYTYHYTTGIATDMNYVKTKSVIDSTRNSEAYSYVDGLGRNLQSAIKMNEDDAIRSNNVFNDRGGVEMKSRAFVTLSESADEYDDDDTPTAIIQSKVELFNDPTGRMKKLFPLGDDDLTLYSENLFGGDGTGGDAYRYATTINENKVYSTSYSNAIGNNNEVSVNNMILNANFEMDEAFWECDASYDTTNTYVRYGLESMKQDTGSANKWCNSKEFITVDPDESYTVCADFYRITGNPVNSKVSYKAYDSDDVEVCDNELISHFLNPVWERECGTFKLSDDQDCNDGEKVKIFFSNDINGGNRAVIDGLQMEKGTVGAPFTSLLNIFDHKSNLVKVIAPNQIVTENVYDTLGRLRATKNPDSGVSRTMKYDSNGNLILSGEDCDWDSGDFNSDPSTYSCERVFGFVYDDLNRLLCTNLLWQSSWHDSWTGTDCDQFSESTHPTIEYIYDDYADSSDCYSDTAFDYPEGKLIAIKDRTSALVNTNCLYYDERGQLRKDIVELTQTNPSRDESFTTYYDYDDAGHNVKTTLSNDYIITSDYNEIAQLKGVNLNTFVYNPSFEYGETDYTMVDDELYEGWTCEGSKYYISDDDAAHGSFSLKKDSGGSAGDVCYSELIPAEELEYYTLCVDFMKSSGTFDNAKAILYYYDSSEDFISGQNVINTQDTTSSWKKYCGSDASPTDTAYVRIRINNNAGFLQGSVIYADGVQLMTGVNVKMPYLSTTYAYDVDGAITDIVHDNGVTTTHAYTNRKWLDYTDIDGAAHLFTRHYEYDNVGNVKELYQSTTTNNLLAEFSYDNLNRLIDVDDNSYYGEDQTFTYDSVGNRLSKNSIDYTFQSGTNQMTNDEVFDYTYDGFGNLETKEDASDSYDYTYNIHNMLMQVKKNNLAQVTNYYDSSNKRVSQINSVDGVLHTYVYAGGMLVMELRECVEDEMYNPETGKCVDV
ncbi:MAG: hypothetical protein ABIH34_00780 [Nanoarchaeota archaeon]